MADEQVVKRVDHISVAVSEPDDLFAVLTGPLGLPPGWAPSPFVGFVSGGVSLGNLILETIHFAPSRKTRLRHDHGALCVAFEPLNTRDAIATLDRRQIAHSPPYPYTAAASETPAHPQMPWQEGTGPLWTVTMLGGFMGDTELARRYEQEARHPRISGITSRLAMFAGGRLGLTDALLAATLPRSGWPFLCEYHRLDIGAGRTVASDELQRVAGGPLGVTGVDEIVLGVADLESERQHWTDLLMPLAADAEDRWHFRDGPAIRLEQSADGPRQRVVLAVSSLGRAAAHLEKNGLEAERADAQIRLDPARLSGLDLRLREADPPLVRSASSSPVAMQGLLGSSHR
jgi:hypothetical protein